MSQMQTVGKTILALRKAHDMTQMELADQLNISFQAVSNWERGSSMPDIAKLPQLAQLFGVTIDEILGEAAPLVTYAAQGNMAEYLKEHSVEAKELAQAAPLLKPRQMDQAVSEIIGKKGLGDLDELEELLPYLPEEILMDLAGRECAQNRVENLERLAPFLPAGALDRLVLDHLEAASTEKLEGILPFLSRSVLDQVARRTAEKTGPEELAGMFPFLSPEALEDVARLSLTHGSPEDLEGMLSFLSREALADLAKTALPQCGLEELEGFFSFLPHQTLAQLALEEYGRKDLDAVPEELLGYLHKEDLILLARAVVKRKGVRGLLPLADWLDKSAWAQLFQEGDR